MGALLVGLVATVAVTVVITRIARLALNRRINPLAEPKQGPRWNHP